VEVSPLPSLPLSASRRPVPALSVPYPLARHAASSPVKVTIFRPPDKSSDGKRARLVRFACSAELSQLHQATAGRAI